MTTTHWLILAGLVVMEGALQLRGYLLRRTRRKIFDRYSALISPSSKAEDSEPWLARAEELEAAERVAQKTSVCGIRLLQLILIGAFVFAFFL